MCMSVLYVCISVHHCVPGTWEDQREHQTHQNWTIDSCEPARGCWDSNPGPEEEQSVLSTTKPPLQPSVSFPSSYLQQDFSLNPGLIIVVNAQWAQGESPVFAFQCGVKDTGSFLVGGGDQNLGPYVCVASDSIKSQTCQSFG